MHFRTIKPHAMSVSAQTNLSFLEDLVRAARSRFAALLDGLAELQARPLPKPPVERRFHDIDPGNRAHGLAGATDDLIAIVTVMDRMAGELLLESKQLWASVGFVSGNVHKIAFGRWRLLGSRKRNDLFAVAVDERLRRTPRLVISLLEVAAILEGAVADLRPAKTGEGAGNG
ncbi:hypothetical protein QCM77_18410 [Bradyrhizobium sp. SSUT18]|uniref:hypothetical protein n=1 Tax=Bradyrhizobium sp. SSUT18 TaxID=3040602 RepID=UPI00244BB5C0|nr:hypothetical protein [Bradyrhizobium sp. SSUT18]MDH2401917.1 hypothetical protein [Bradyrhizobium sp. SSUT18]